MVCWRFVDAHCIVWNALLWTNLTNLSQDVMLVSSCVKKGANYNALLRGHTQQHLQWPATVRQCCYTRIAPASSSWVYLRKSFLRTRMRMVARNPVSSSTVTHELMMLNQWICSSRHSLLFIRFLVLLAIIKAGLTALVVSQRIPSQRHCRHFDVDM